VRGAIGNFQANHHTGHSLHPVPPGLPSHPQTVECAHELVQATRSHECRVDNVWSVSRPNDKNVFALADAVNLSQQLIDHSVHRSVRVLALATHDGDGVQLIEEQDAGGSSSEQCQRKISPYPPKGARRETGKVGSGICTYLARSNTILTFASLSPK